MKSIFAVVFSDKIQDATQEILAQKCEVYSAKAVHQNSKSQCPLGSLTVWNKGMVFQLNFYLLLLVNCFRAPFTI